SVEDRRPGRALVADQADVPWRVRIGTMSRVGQDLPNRLDILDSHRKRTRFVGRPADADQERVPVIESGPHMAFPESTMIDTAQRLWKATAPTSAARPEGLTSMPVR